MAGQSGGAAGSQASTEGAAASAGEQQEAVDKLIADQSRRQRISADEAPAALADAVAANPDVCAWLCVPGTNVSLAVTRRVGDDSYYYTHDATGAHSVVGSAYMEQVNSLAFDDPVTLVYGHSFSDADIMFTDLHKFEDSTFFSAHEEFLVYMPDRVLTYRIASACPYTDVDVLKSYDFSDAAVLQAYLDFAADPESPYGHQRDVGSLVAGRDRIVQLSTCMLPQVEGARYVMTGVLVDEQAL